MSRVTDIILACPAYEEDNGQLSLGLEYVKKHILELDGRLSWPKNIDTIAGGSKHMISNLYAWGANHLDLQGFLDIIANAPWQYIDEIQLFVKGEEDSRFKMYNLQENKTWLIY